MQPFKSTLPLNLSIGLTEPAFSGRKQLLDFPQLKAVCSSNALAAQGSDKRIFVSQQLRIF
jgi:hypothetical protein